MNNKKYDIINKEGVSMRKYKDGEIVTAVVTGIEKYGIFVSFDDYYTGLIHISQISSDFVKNINDYVEIGEIIKAKIIDENPKGRKFRLSIKNIEYRISKKNNSKIKETPSGFLTLKSMLPSWVSSKEKELMENSNIKK